MAFTRGTKHELLELLEALCEERLTDAQALRLEEIVLAHRPARRIYLDYLHLHGTLTWDAARADAAAIGWPGLEPQSGETPVADPPWRGVPASRPGFRAAPSNPGHPAGGNRTRAGAMALIVAAALVITAGVFLWNRRSDAPMAPAVTDADVDSEADSVEDAREIAAAETRPYYRAVDIPFHREFATGPREPVVATRPVDSVPMPGDLVAFIDNQIAQTWKAAEISPSRRASDAAWLRRVYLDLAGRIPTAADVTAFLENEDPDKRRAVVNRLLASDDVSRHFATIWTNLLVGRSDRMARPADRDALFAFLKKTFAENRPWDQVAASFISAEGPIDKKPAGNFLVAHLNNQAVPATAITARIFLGTQVQCMQCHNHPFNDWTQQDFWELNAFFKQTDLVRDDRKVPTLVSKTLGGPMLFETRKGLMQAAYPIFAGKSISDEPSVNRRDRLAKLMSAGEKPQLAEAFVNRLWAQLLGAGFTNPIDDMGPHNPPTHPLVLDRLSRAFVDSGYDVRQLVRWITSTRAYHLSSRFNDSNTIDNPAIGELPLFSRAYPKSMTVEQAYDSLLVATLVDPPLEKLARRDKWVMQFVETYQTDENNESIQFAGSIPAALALMNGDLTEAGLKPTDGTRLHAILTAPGKQPDKLDHLALATLGRHLTPEELAAFTRIIHGRLQRVPPVARTTTRVAAYQDVLWALLNSAEFMTVP